jgi:RHH-type rel operon transcriptional repressor/antitoxin RelB
MDMITVRLPQELEARLVAMCAETRRSKSFLMKDALEYFLDDLEDVIESKRKPSTEFVSSEVVGKNLGLDECTK